MLRSILIGSLISLTASVSYAEHNYAPDVTQERFEATDGVIDHLIPAPATNRHTHYLAEFTAYNSLQNSWAWRVYGDDKSGTYRIKSWEIHRSQDRKSETEKNILEREITKELAQLIYTAWTNAILDSRYTLVMSKGLDGATYNFSTYLRSVGWISGEIWSPSKELPPRWLVEIGINIYKESRKDISTPFSSTKKMKELNSRLSSYKTPTSSL